MARIDVRHSLCAAGKVSLALVLALALSVPYFGAFAPRAYAASQDAVEQEHIGEPASREQSDFSTGESRDPDAPWGAYDAPQAYSIDLSVLPSDAGREEARGYSLQSSSEYEGYADQSDGEWTYLSYDSDTVLVTGYTGSASSITLPERLGGYRVVGVGVGFACPRNVFSITLPASYELIGGWAFTGYFNLKEIVIPENSKLSIIGSQAFANTGLTEFVMPASLKTVNNGVFHGCPDLKRIVFNENVEPFVEHQNVSSGSDSFQYDEPYAIAPYSAVEFVVPERSKNFKVVGDALYSKDGSTLYQLSSKYANASFAVPSGVTSLAKESFKGVETLKSVTLPSTLTTICDEAFAYSGLTSFDIPDSVTNVYGQICYGCSDLRSVTIGNGVTELGMYAGWECFFRCSSLSEVKLGESLRVIGNACFAETALTTVDLPASVEQINYGAFGDIPTLSTVTGAEGVKTINNLAFRNANIASFPFGDNVLFIHRDAFYQCKNFNGVYPSYLEKTYEGDYVSYGKVIVDGTDMYTYAYQVLDLVNQQRALAGLNPLTMDKDLLRGAMLRAAETSVFWDHIRPNGEDCFTVSPKAYGENIAIGQWSPESVMDGWMNSEGHRANILGESWNSIGIGCFQSPNGVLHWVQLFGSAQGSNPAPRADETSQYNVFVNPDFLDLYFMVEPVGTSLGDWTCLDKGRTYPLSLSVQNAGYPYFQTRINPATFKWASSDESVVSMAAPGVFAAGSKDATARVSALFGPLEYEFRVLVGHNPNRLFYDVDNHWGEGWIMAAQERGLVSGKLDGEGNLTGEFAPDEDVTRGQFAVILYRNEFPDSNATNDVAAFEDNKTPLKDLEDKQYYTAAINWAYAEGIITGDTNEDGSPAYKVRPGDPIKRQDAATMIARYAKSKGLSAAGDPSVFASAPDAADVAGYAAPFVAWCYENGIMTGDTVTGKLNPTDSTLRAAIAKISVVSAEVIERHS